MEMHPELNVFNVMVTYYDQFLEEGRVYTGLVKNGIVLDFTPTQEQEKYLIQKFQPLNVNTLFSKEERAKSDPYDLIIKQLTHYYITYGLGAGEVFDITFDNGQKTNIRMIRGISKQELRSKTMEKLYTNAPASQLDDLEAIVEKYDVPFSLNRVQNNEMRVRLFDPAKHVFTDGDDAVRWMVYKTTGDTLLIKSNDVIQKMKEWNKLISPLFLENHCVILSKVFNRHKRLILAVKNSTNHAEINRISKLSKVNHKPIGEHPSKTFIVDYCDGKGANFDILSNRDIFKILNAICVRKHGFDLNVYLIRNGKMKVESTKKEFDKKKLKSLEERLLDVLKYRLTHLNKKSILLDETVDYGLPVSEKQTVGRLPFWTKVDLTDKKNISSGIYWENSWGAYDLDLSAVNSDGSRTGWGQMSGYTDRDPMFSGDVTNAHKGAMEFMQSKKSNFALINNIYSGSIGCGVEVVIGSGSKSKWIKDVIVREKTNMDSRCCLLGFVKGKEYTAFKARYGNGSISSPSRVFLEMMKVDFWTVKKLFDRINIAYDEIKDEDEKYDFSLEYQDFSFDKLTDLIL